MEILKDYKQKSGKEIIINREKECDRCFGKMFCEKDDIIIDGKISKTCKKCSGKGVIVEKS